MLTLSTGRRDRSGRPVQVRHQHLPEHIVRKEPVRDRREGWYETGTAGIGGNHGIGEGVDHE